MDAIKVRIQRLYLGSTSVRFLAFISAPQMAGFGRYA
jgi:hypothetical protein